MTPKQIKLGNNLIALFAVMVFIFYLGLFLLVAFQGKHEGYMRLKPSSKYEIDNWIDSLTKIKDGRKKN